MKIAASFLLFALAAWPQVASQANARYHTKEGRAAVARGLDNPNRDAQQKPEQIIAAMKIKPGMTLADIGTGTGYMLPYLSRATGPSGKVFGEDIQTDFLDRARPKVASDHLTNVDLVLGNETDPKLPPNSTDIALVLEVYHHFDYPAKMLANISRELKSSGHLVIVDFYKKDQPQHIRLERDDVAKEVEANGFRLLSKIDQIGNKQYMLTFAKK